MAARKIATFDHLTEGRIALHIISGASDAEQEGDGDFAPKEERYRRAAEYIEVMKLAWTSARRFDFSGEFYECAARSPMCSRCRSRIRSLFFGGSSEGALAMGSKHCDVFAMFGEPLRRPAQRIAEFRARAAAFGRTPTFNMSFRPILGATEERPGIAPVASWRRSASPAIQRASATTRSRSTIRRGGCSVSRPRARPTTHGSGCPSPRRPAPWAIRPAWSARPSRSPALLEYYKLGIHSFLIRGFDPFEDTIDFGRELIPRLRAGAAELDRAKAAARVSAVPLPLLARIGRARGLRIAASHARMASSRQGAHSAEVLGRGKSTVSNSVMDRSEKVRAPIASCHRSMMSYRQSGTRLLARKASCRRATQRSNRRGPTVALDTD